ncbi:PQQ-binding-like beta-propeller repeat protein [Embleya sp. NPDC050154]|uniref:outer membrane protein assembly factor BamB family protein n=1 Tax=Embleya sp. NPDC050154 TaxID=3363988 RepID=UPI0037AFC337
MPGVRTLGEVLDHDGPLADGPLREVAAGIADALARVHAIGLVHGRLGPDQVLITPYGPRVTGFAGRTDADDGGDPSEDVYAFGTLITLAGGGTPSAELSPLLRRCLDPDPGQRPTAVDVDRVLTPRPSILVLPAAPARERADMPQAARAQDPPTGSRLTRRRLLIAGGFAVTAATVTSAGVAFARLGEGRSQPKTRWRRAVEGRVTTLQVFDNVAYCTTTENVVMALGTETGVALWTARTESMVWSEPVVSGTAVFLACVAGQLSALDPGNGERVWQQYAGDQILGAPVMLGSSLVVGTRDDRVLAFDIAQGAHRWEWSESAQRGGVMPAVIGENGGGDLVYLTHTDGTVSAIVPERGEPRWSIHLAAPITRPPHVVRDLVYVVTGFTLVALNIATGEIVWRFRGTPDLTAPVVVDDIIYTTDVGTLYALDARTGAERWRRTTGAGVPSPVAVVDGIAYAGGTDELHAFDRATGRRRWTHPLSTYLTAAAAGTGEVLLLGTAGSELVALES